MKGLALGGGEREAKRGGEGQESSPGAAAAWRDMHPCREGCEQLASPRQDQAAQDQKLRQGEGVGSQAWVGGLPPAQPHLCPRAAPGGSSVTSSWSWCQGMPWGAGSCCSPCCWGLPSRGPCARGDGPSSPSSSSLPRYLQWYPGAPSPGVGWHLWHQALESWLGWVKTSWVMGALVPAWVSAVGSLFTPDPGYPPQGQLLGP